MRQTFTVTGRESCLREPKPTAEHADGAFGHRVTLVNRCRLGVACVCVLGVTTMARQGDEPKPTEPPAQPAVEPAKPAPPPDLPNLDELLGITPARPTGEHDRAREELQERLTAGQAMDQFQQAVTLMGQAATRLRAARDPGLDTQRIQEDVVRKLDQLIEFARQQQQQSSSSSQSSARRDQQRQQPNQPQSNEQAGDAENMGEVDPPGRRDGALRPDSAPNEAAWGALPARIREALRQSGDDRFSSLYKSLTEAYYRRLAEEAGR